MCLWTKTDLPGPEFDGYCYKLVKLSKDGKVVIGGMSAGVPYVKLSGNRWTRDTVVRAIKYSYIPHEYYVSGFHCFLNLGDAEKVKNNEDSFDSPLEIIKVRVRDILAAGIQGWYIDGGCTVLGNMPSIVAREIRFVKRMP